MTRLIGKKDGKIVFDKCANPIISPMDIDEFGWHMTHDGTFDSYTVLVDDEIYSEYEL